MDATQKKSLALLIGLAAVAVAIALCFIHSGVTVGNFAGGSGDSSNPVYTQPSVPAMSVDPTGMSLGSTITESVAPTALATMVASPTYKATAAPGCVNNGQCP
jgi:hypothetical protein